MTTRTEKLKWSGMAAAVGAALAILFFFSPTQHPFYPRCPLHAMTGLHCPGCGSLRAIHSLLHGDLASALHFNALLVLALPFLVWLGFNWLRASRGTAAPNTGPRPVWFWLFFGTVMAFGVLRNLPFAPFSHLAP